MAKQGRIRLEQFADSVLNYIKGQVSNGINNHTHNVNDLEDADTLAKNTDIIRIDSDLDTVKTNISDMNNVLNNKSEKGHTHTVSEIEGENGEDLTVILNSSTKGYLFIDEKSSNNLTNCIVVDPADGNTIGSVVRTEAQGDFSVKYHIGKDRLCLGRNVIKFRSKSSVTNNEKIKIKITSISSTDINITEGRELGEIYVKEIALSQIHENYTDIYDVIDLKLFAANSVGIEITIQQENKTADAVIEIDHMVVMPAFPGIFLS